MKKKRFVILLLAVVIGAALSYGYIRNRESADPNKISVSGNIEVTDAEISFKIAGPVEERLVSEGELVNAGQTVARLDSTDLVQEVTLRKAEVHAAQAVLAELEAGSRPEEIQEAESSLEKAQARLDELLAGSRSQEIDAAKAAVERARAEAQRWKAEYQRQEKLYKETVISDREYEEAKTVYQSAHQKLREAEENLKLVIEGPRKEEIEQARAAVRQAKARRDLVKSGPRKETIERTRAELEQAKARLALSETTLGYATLAAPLSGVVLSENVEPGEYVAPGTPVVTIGNLERVWLRAYINETDLGRVKVGQPVRVTTDTYPGKTYEGKISFISSRAEFTPKNVQTTEERVKLVYRIKVDLMNPAMELKPGMPADAEIHTGASS